MIAQAFSRFNTDDHVLIFASGVANSQETAEAEYERERVCLASALRDHADKTFVYFSTCSVHDPDVSASPYVTHKVRMEHIVRSTHGDHIIFRLPQVVGRSSNRATLVNFLYDKIEKGEHFVAWQQAVRYLIDVQDVVKIASYIIDERSLRNATIDIVSVKCAVLDIIAALEKITGKRPHFTRIDRGTPYAIDGTYAAGVAALLHISFDEHYLDNLMKKYFS